MNVQSPYFLQAEQNEYLLDLPSYVSSLSKAELNLSGQCEQLRTFFTFVSFPGQNTENVKAHADFFCLSVLF